MFNNLRNGKFIAAIVGVAMFFETLSANASIINNYEILSNEESEADYELLTAEESESDEVDNEESLVIHNDDLDLGKTISDNELTDDLENNDDEDDDEDDDEEEKKYVLFGNMGKYVTWKYGGNELVFDGTGIITPDRTDVSQFGDWAKEIKYIKIGDDISGIAAYAFRDLVNLKYVDFGYGDAMEGTSREPIFWGCNPNATIFCEYDERFPNRRCIEVDEDGNRLFVVENSWSEYEYWRDLKVTGTILYEHESFIPSGAYEDCELKYIFLQGDAELKGQPFAGMKVKPIILSELTPEVGAKYSDDNLSGVEKCIFNCEYYSYFHASYGNSWQEPGTKIDPKKIKGELEYGYETILEGDTSKKKVRVPIEHLEVNEGDYEVYPDKISPGKRTYDIEYINELAGVYVGYKRSDQFEILGSQRTPELVLKEIKATLNGYYDVGEKINHDDFEVYPIYDLVCFTNEKLIAIEQKGEILPSDIFSVSTDVMTDRSIYVTVSYTENGRTASTRLIARNPGKTISLKSTHYPPEKEVYEGRVYWEEPSEGFEFKLSKNVYNYTGEENLPSVTALFYKYKAKTVYHETKYDSWQTTTYSKQIIKLVENNDFVVKYENAAGTGDAYAVVTGVGLYGDTVRLPYKIKKKSISNANPVVGNIQYTGNDLSEEIKSSVVLYDGDRVIEASDYNVEIKGDTVGREGTNSKVTLTFSATGSGNYTGSVKSSVEVYIIGDKNAKNIADAEIQINIKQPLVYTGKFIKPSATVILEGTKLKNKKDYQISYSDNLDSGTAYVHIYGKNNYYGHVSKPFVIGKTSFKKVKNTLVPKIEIPLSYDELAAKVTFGKKLLKEGVDYKVEYPALSSIDVTNGKTASIKVKIISLGTNFTEGEFNEVSVKILPRNIKDKKRCSLYLEDDEFYIDRGDDDVFEPSIKIMYGENYLKQGEDYTVEYKNNSKVGTGKVVVNGMGIYTGELTATFQIKYYRYW